MCKSYVFPSFILLYIYVFFYYCHWIYTSDGGLFVLDCSIGPVVSVYITGSIPLMVDYLSLTVASAY
jgi:hypothetical protein